MEELILDFINRRFKEDCNWTTGNCYYFAKILQAAFGGELWYDSVECHFVCEIGGKFWDWNGEYKDNDNLVRWDKYARFDILRYERIVRDVIC